MTGSAHCIVTPGRVAAAHMRTDVGAEPGASWGHRIANGGTQLAKWASLTALAVGLVSALISVEGRYVTVYALQGDWADEVARGMLAWITFMASAILIHDNDHIQLELPDARLPPRLRWLRATAADVLTAVGLLVVFWYSIPVFENDTSVMMVSLPLPVAVFSASLVLGTALQVFFVLWRVRQRGWLPSRQATTDPD